MKALNQLLSSVSKRGGAPRCCARLLATGKGNRPRLTEWVFCGYFLYTLALALLLELEPAARARTIAASLLALAVLHYLGRSPVRWVPASLRNLLPIAGVLLAYKQMGWFARPQESLALEEAWVRWDRLLLDAWGVGDAIEALGPLVPGLLELLYLLTYVVGPAGLLILIACGRLDRADRYLACFVASAVAAYALYPYFPSEPPRTVFPGDMFGPYDTAFRKLNWWILGRGGIHTSVFPSGHVSSACGAGFGLLLALPERKIFGIAMTAFAIGIAIATVYGRYHYAVDALAGLVTSGAASLACWYGFRRWDARKKA